MGAFDMLGNAAEWCFNTELTAELGARPIRYLLGGRYMVRGGDYLTNASALRAANRRDEVAVSLLLRQGFRIAHTVTKTAQPD